MAVAKRLYKEFVGEPFERARKRAKPRTRPTATATPRTIPQELPPAWLLREIMERSLGEQRAR
jgi:hypothetical protein